MSDTMNNDWLFCNGMGTLDTTAAPPSPHIVLPAGITRRQALARVGMGAVAWLAGGRGALADLAIAPSRKEASGDVLVTLFLRGGADGLNIIVPHGEDAYHRRRPTLGLSAPNDRAASPANRALDLDGFFGFHPSLAPLLPLYREGLLAGVHACGSGDESRSHFESMATIERGLRDQRAGEASGWLARHLAATEGGSASPLRAVAFSSTMPDSLRGAGQATAIQSLNDLRLSVPGAAKRETAMRHALTDLYAHGKDAVAEAGRETLEVLATLNRLNPALDRPRNGAVYPKSDLGSGFQQVASLIRANVGLEVACLDRGGWDTHVAQGGASGWLAGLLSDVALSLSAFAADVGRGMDRVTVVVMTEFGRRVRENSGLGTDHGRGTMMMVIGGGIAGGRIFSRWPGLEDHQLEGPGDLRVTTDYRDVLAELVSRRLGNNRLAAVFPGYAPQFHNLAKQAVS